jgi:hypothetical protein
MKMRPNLERLYAEAHRQRAAEVHRLIFAPIAAWFRRPAKQAPRSAATTFRTAW